jgi:ElaB/YqjD/DUF883 family membrane-anchored ribosome-binding protein
MDSTIAAAPNTPTRDSRDQRQRLARSLQAMVDEADQLLRSAQLQGSEKLTALHDKLELQLHEARKELGILREDATHNMRRAAHAADRTVHQHPYAAVGMAAALGAVLGMLIARR